MRSSCRRLRRFRCQLARCRLRRLPSAMRRRVAGAGPHSFPSGAVPFPPPAAVAAPIAIVQAALPAPMASTASRRGRESSCGHPSCRHRSLFHMPRRLRGPCRLSRRRLSCSSRQSCRRCRATRFDPTCRRRLHPTRSPDWIGCSVSRQLAARLRFICRRPRDLRFASTAMCRPSTARPCWDRTMSSRSC